MDQVAQTEPEVIEEPVVPIESEVTTEPVVPTESEVTKVPSASDRLVSPHEKKSRLVTDADVERVVEEAKVLYTLCLMPVGRYMGAFAVHHSQIDDKDPLNFFVLVNRDIIINPVILNHSNYFKDSLEACLTFADRQQVIVPRWQKCEVEYQSVMVDQNDSTKFKLSSIIQASLSGRDAWVFQHEVDHGEAKYIYTWEK